MDKLLNASNSIKVEYKLSGKDLNLLMDAYRRFNVEHKFNKVHVEKFIAGIGTAKEYESKYFSPEQTNTNGNIINHYLTLRGIAVISTINDSIKWKNKYNELICANYSK